MKCWDLDQSLTRQLQTVNRSRPWKPIRANCFLILQHNRKIKVNWVDKRPKFLPHHLKNKWCWQAVKWHISLDLKWLLGHKVRVLRPKLLSKLSLKKAKWWQETFSTLVTHRVKILLPMLETRVHPSNNIMKSWSKQSHKQLIWKQNRT